MQWEADVWVDAASTIVPTCQPHLSKDAVDEAGIKAVKDMVVMFADKMAVSLNRGQPFLVGTMPCIGDFAIYGFLGSMMFHNPTNKHKEVLDKIFDDVCNDKPMFKAYMKRMMEENKTHMMNRPPAPF